MPSAEEIQRDYYSANAERYDDQHLNGSADYQHDFALYVLDGIISGHNLRYILDVGAGTGRAMRYLQSENTERIVNGVEPVEALRNVAISKGVSPNRIVAGDGSRLPFEDNKFDIACAFGVLHHVSNPEKMIGEMLRVAKWGIFISDSNNFGQGSGLQRTIKQVFHKLGLWKALNFVRTNGKSYQISETDGLYYSYSLFDNISQIKKACSRVHLIGTENSSANLYKSAGHVGLLGIKR